MNLSPLSLDPNIPETGKQMEHSMYGESCCYDYCDAAPSSQRYNGSHFCIRNRTSCLQQKHMTPHCTPVEQTDSGYYYFSPPAAHTSGSTSPSPSLLSMFVLVISVPTILNLSSALLPMLSSSLLTLSMLKLQLKSILKSLLSCLLPSPCLLLSRLRLLLVTCSIFVISCSFCILRIASRNVTRLMVVSCPTLSLLSKSTHMCYDGVLLNVSFKSIVQMLRPFSLIESLPRFFYKLIFTLFQLFSRFCLHFSRFLTSLTFNIIRYRWSQRTDSNSSYGETLFLDKLSRIRKLNKSELILTFTNVKSNVLIIHKHNLVLVVINLFLILINFLLERAVIVLLKLCYSLNFDCLNKIKLKKLYEKQFVINLLFTLINLSQHYCFLSGSVNYYYDKYYYLLFKIILSLLLLCRYNNYQLLFTMNIFTTEYELCDYSFR